MADKTYALDSGTTKGKFVDIGSDLFAKADVPLVKTAAGLYLPFPLTDAGYYPAILQASSAIVGKVGIDPANNSVQLSGSNVADETDKAATANTDILTDITATKTEMTTLMVATGTGGILSLKVDAKLASLNGGVALNANQWYAFDIPMLAAAVYNLQLSVNATIQIKWIGGI